MLLILVVLAIGIIAFVLMTIFDTFDFDLPYLLSLTIGVISLVTVLVMLISVVAVQTTTDSFIAKNNEEYKSLYYQATSGMFDGEETRSKKELVNQITSWNQEIVKGRINQDNIWINWFYRHVYDQFKLIPIELVK